MSIASKIKKNVKLAPLTTFKIGGPAEYFINVTNQEHLAEAISWAKDNKQAITILAGGSNVLINDQGIKGLVIKLCLTGLISQDKKIEAGASVHLAELVNLAYQRGLTGLEWASGIPGTIGGAVYGNAGAFGRQTGQLVFKIVAFDCRKKKFIVLSNHQCDFSYRDSVFKRKGDLVITRVILKLSEGRKVDIGRLIKKYHDYRFRTQPKYPSAGSIFKNLLITKLAIQNPELAKQLKRQGSVKGDKVAVARLIDQLKFKGETVGGAKISQQHANFIVNTGKAKANDVVKLIGLIKKTVAVKYRVVLEEEIKYLGF